MWGREGLGGFLTGVGGRWGKGKGGKMGKGEGREGYTIRLKNKQPLRASSRKALINPEISQELTDLLLAAGAHVGRNTNTPRRKRVSNSQPVFFNPSLLPSP